MNFTRHRSRCHSHIRTDIVEIDLTGVMVHVAYYRKNRVVFVWPGAAHAPIRSERRSVYSMHQKISPEFRRDRSTFGRMATEKHVEVGHCLMSMVVKKFGVYDSVTDTAAYRSWGLEVLTLDPLKICRRGQGMF